MLKKAKTSAASDMHLNITSLMDILTILLLFLILSFDSQEQHISPPEDIELPASTSDTKIELAVKLSVSTQSVIVEDKVVAKLKDGRFRKADLDKANLVRPVLRELRRQKARLQSGSKTAKSSVDEEDETEIVYFEAGQGAKYHIIDRLLMTAAAAGFTKFRLAVHRKG